MSTIKFLDCRDRALWVHDVGFGVFLKYLIDAAEASPQAAGPWLADAVSQCRLAACVGDIGFDFNEHWPAGELHTFVSLGEEACARLAQR